LQKNLDEARVEVSLSVQRKSRTNMKKLDVNDMRDECNDTKKSFLSQLEDEDD